MKPGWRAARRGDLAQGPGRARAFAGSGPKAAHIPPGCLRPGRTERGAQGVNVTGYRPVTQPGTGHQGGSTLSPACALAAVPRSVRALASRFVHVF